MQIPPFMKMFMMPRSVMNAGKDNQNGGLEKYANAAFRKDVPAALASFGKGMTPAGSSVYPDISRANQDGLSADGSNDTDYSYENLREFFETQVVNLSNPEFSSYQNYELLRERWEGETVPLSAEYVEALTAERNNPIQRTMEIIRYEGDGGRIASALRRGVSGVMADLYPSYYETEEYKNAIESTKGKRVILGNLNWQRDAYENSIPSDLQAKKAWLNSLYKVDENNRTPFQEIGDKLAEAAKAYQNNPAATPEERAMQREAVVRMASEIADQLGLTKEQAQPLMSEIYVQLGQDAAREAFSEKLTGGKGTQVNGANYLQENYSYLYDKSKVEILGRQDSLAITIIQNLLDGINTDYLRGAYTSYFLKTDVLAEQARNNFDSAISEGRFSSVNRWQNEMRDFLSQYLFALASNTNVPAK